MLLEPPAGPVVGADTRTAPILNYALFKLCVRRACKIVALRVAHLYRLVLRSGHALGVIELAEELHAGDLNLRQEREHLDLDTIGES